MKRSIILILAAALIPIGVLKAVVCEWDEYVDDDTVGCECVGYHHYPFVPGYCVGVGYLEVTWTCPSDGECPLCETCYERAARFPTKVLIYAEPDCFLYTQYDYCSSEAQCGLDGWDTSTQVWDYLGVCDCWDF